MTRILPIDPSNPDPPAAVSTTQAPDHIDDGDSDNLDDSRPLSETILPFILLAGAVILILLIFLLLSVFISRRSARAARELAAAHPVDIESHPDAIAIQRLESIIPSKTLKAASAEIPGLVSKAGGGGDGPTSVVICVICLEKLTPKSVVRCLPCHHVFHSPCIDEWYLKGHYTCPVCIRGYCNTHPE